MNIIGVYLEVNLDNGVIAGFTVSPNKKISRSLGDAYKDVKELEWLTAEVHLAEHVCAKRVITEQEGEQLYLS